MGVVTLIGRASIEEGVIFRWGRGFRLWFRGRGGAPGQGVEFPGKRHGFEARDMVQGCSYRAGGVGQVQCCMCRGAGTRLQAQGCRYRTGGAGVQVQGCRYRASAGQQEQGCSYRASGQGFGFPGRRRGFEARVMDSDSGRGFTLRP